MLQDESRLSVDDPVEKYLPEFKNQWLIESRSDDKLALTRPPRPIRLRDLLTHTSGLGDVPVNLLLLTQAQRQEAISKSAIRSALASGPAKEHSA